MSVDLPIGKWKAKLQGDQTPIEVEPAGSRSVACWRISLARMYESKPFTLELSESDGKEPSILMEIRPKYPGQGFVDGVLTVLSWIARSNTHP